MKQKWGKILIILIPIVAAVFLLLPTYQAYQLEETKAEFIQRADDSDSAADSLAIMDEYKRTYGQDLQEAKSQQIKLGLDLRGGMYVTLEIDLVKLIDESAQREAKDPIFEQVIEKTREDAAASDENALDIFLKNFNEIARPEGKTLISYFDIGDLRDASEEKIVERLEYNSEQAIQQAQEVIRQRIDQYGVSEPNIQLQGNRRIILELPGVTNEQEMRNLLQTTARLEFNLVRNNKEIVEAFAKIDALLVNKNKRNSDKVEEVIEETTETEVVEEMTQEDVVTGDEEITEETIADTTEMIEEEIAETPTDTTQKSQEEQVAEYLEQHPFTSLFSTMYSANKQSRSQQVLYNVPNFPEGEYSFQIFADSIPKMKEILSRPEVRPLIPADLKIAIEAKPISYFEKNENLEIYYFHTLKKDPELTGEVITNATATFDQTNNAPIVTMSMNSDGAEKWARITGANVNKRIAIVLDDRVYSAPNVNQRILGGRSVIEGMEDAQEAKLLEIVLKAGALKAPVQIIEERVVGPSLGADSINSGVNASMVAFLVVILYMLVYYARGGLIADFAVFLNVTLIVSFLAMLQGTLTLPGIAGIILTIGMAVDANVLIFERIREEIAKGRSLKSSIDEGYSKALSAIIDSNITTGITALILNFLGSGPIQGFAITLLIGIVCTLFTAIVVTKAVLDISVSKGAASFSFGQPKVVQANN